jgi:hypothetical protein
MSPNLLNRNILWNIGRNIRLLSDQMPHNLEDADGTVPHQPIMCSPRLRFAAILAGPFGINFQRHRCTCALDEPLPHRDGHG